MDYLQNFPNHGLELAFSLRHEGDDSREFVQDGGEECDSRDVGSDDRGTSRYCGG